MEIAVLKQSLFQKKMSMQRKVIRIFFSILECLGFYNRFGAVFYSVLMIVLSFGPAILNLEKPSKVPGKFCLNTI